jgi:hypothetical protein
MRTREGPDRNHPKAGLPAKGRHRRGIAYQAVRPEHWDASERAAADQISRMGPSWLVW